MEEERALQTKEYHEQREHASARAATSRAGVVAPAISNHTEPQAETLDEVIARIDSLKNAQDKKDYLSSLTVDMRTRAVTFIKERKFAEEKAKAEAEFDGLFD